METRDSSLADRLDIQDVIVRYCTAIDSRSFDMLDRVFTPDGIADYRAAGGIRGTLPEIKVWLAQALAPFTVIQHMVGNFQIELDGNTARSKCYLFNPLGFPADNGGVDMLFCGGGYEDRLTRTIDGWRIKERVISTLYLHGNLPKR